MKNHVETAKPPNTSNRNPSTNVLPAREYWAVINNETGKVILHPDTSTGGWHLEAAGNVQVGSTLLQERR